MAGDKERTLADNKELTLAELDRISGGDVKLQHEPVRNEPVRPRITVDKSVLPPGSGATQ